LLTFDRLQQGGDGVAAFFDSRFERTFVQAVDLTVDGLRKIIRSPLRASILPDYIGVNRDIFGPFAGCLLIP